MFMVSHRLKLAVVTGHIPLKDVASQITEEKILSKLRLIHASLRQDFMVDRPLIAVLSLNPHSGDGGLLGTEEQDIIIPAIRKANEEGILAYGPFSPDGYFGLSHYEKFDATLAMYHDQGLAPFKALSFEDGVNFTAGLPIVRTSPDHGTAFEMAGHDEADPLSMRAAIFTAVDIWRNRRAWEELQAGKMEKRELADSPQEGAPRQAPDSLTKHTNHHNDRRDELTQVPARAARSSRADTRRTRRRRHVAAHADLPAHRTYARERLHPRRRRHLQHQPGFAERRGGAVRRRLHRRGGVARRAALHQPPLRLQPDTEAQLRGARLPARRILGAQPRAGAAQSRTQRDVP